MGGTGAGLGTIAAIYATGWVSDRYSFEPILLGASIVPGCPVIPLGTDEVHLHIVEDGVEVIEAVWRDLSLLAISCEQPVNIARRAA